MSNGILTRDRIKRKLIDLTKRIEIFIRNIKSKNYMHHFNKYYMELCFKFFKCFKNHQEEEKQQTEKQVNKWCTKKLYMNALMLNSILVLPKKHKSRQKLSEKNVLRKPYFP